MLFFPLQLYEIAGRSGYLAARRDFFASSIGHLSAAAAWLPRLTGASDQPSRPSRGQA
jgi:hypothetical protein